MAPMVRMGLQVQNARLVRKGLEDLSKAIPDIGRSTIYRQLLLTRRSLAAPPSIAPGPYPWKTRKQRLWVTRAIKSGLLKRPYVMSGRYSHGWRIYKYKEGWVLTNDTPYTHWVAGAKDTSQARIHGGRWMSLRRAMEDLRNSVPNEVRKNMAAFLTNRRNA